MKYLHALRPMIIHRDLKSSNLLVDERDVLKISDFGLSRIKMRVSTVSGMLGTPGWSALKSTSRYTQRRLTCIPAQWSMKWSLVKSRTLV